MEGPAAQAAPGAGSTTRETLTLNGTTLSRDDAGDGGPGGVPTADSATAGAGGSGGNGGGLAPTAARRPIENGLNARG